MEVRFESEVRKRPVGEDRVSFTFPFPLTGEGSPEELGGTSRALDVTSAIAAAREFLSSIISLSQSDFPVEIII